MSNSTLFLASTLLWKGTLLLLAGWALSCLLHKASASSRHWLWCLTFAALLLTFALPSVLPRWRLNVLPKENVKVSAVVGGRAASEGSVSTSDYTRPANRVPWFSALWLAGLVFFLGRIALDLKALHRIRRQSQSLPASQRKLKVHCLERMGLNGSVEVLLTPCVQVPMIWALRRPVILLPESANRWSDERLRFVLSHELGHMKRYDSLTTLLTQVVCALYWVNPLVWLAARKLYLEREQACDQLVLSSGAERLGYARQLLELARLLQPARGGAGLAMADKAGLKCRIQRILDSERSSFSMSRRTAVFSAVATLVIVIPLTSIQLRARAGAMSSSALEVSLAMLRDGSPSEKKRAAWSLGEGEDPRAVEPLIQMLSIPDPELRGLVAWALGEIKDRRAVAPLVRVLDDEDAYAREMIVRAIGEIEDPQAVPHLKRALEDPNGAVRAAAVWSLGEIRNREALQAVSGAVSDPDPLVQTKAMLVMVDADQDVAPKPLITALSNPDAKVRQEAARALGRIGDPQAVEALIERLRDPDPEVRSWTVWALDEIHVSR